MGQDFLFRRKSRASSFLPPQSDGALESQIHVLLVPAYIDCCCASSLPATFYFLSDLSIRGLLGGLVVGRWAGVMRELGSCAPLQLAESKQLISCLLRCLAG